MHRFLTGLTWLAVLSLTFTNAALALPSLPGPPTIGDPGLVIDEPPEHPRMIRFAERDYGDTWIEMVAQTGSTTSTLHRARGPQGPWTTLRTLAPSTSQVVRDEGLTPGGFYCYEVRTSPYGVDFGPLCRTLEWTRVVFEGRITRSESERVLDAFDWRRTDSLYELDVYERPALYYMNVLLRGDQFDAIDDLRSLGMHVDELPMTTAERAGWSSDSTIAWEEGRPIGRWVYAVVPAAVYNDVRAASLDQLDAGDAPDIGAIVFRRSPVEASRIATDPHQLRYEYLADQGFEYNATSTASACPEGAVCQPILGRILRIVVSKVVETAQDTIDAVRQAFNFFDTIARGSATIELELVPMNTDPTFGTSPMESAWRGEQMIVANLPIQIRQGFGMNKDSTNAEGLVRTVVAKGVESSLCLELENEFVQFVSGWMKSKVICFDEGFEWNAHSTAPERVELRNHELNAFLQMSDAAEFVDEVFGHRMNQTSVLVGGMANLLTVNSRPYAPCLGRGWNATTVGFANLPSLLNSSFQGVSTLAEMNMSVDIVMDDEIMGSRGVGVHEFGHVVMCSFLNREAGDPGSVAWSDVIQASLNQDDDNEARAIAEGFADYIASQVVGGTNYYMPVGSVAGHMDKMAWCLDGQACLDHDYSSQATFNARTVRYASLIHDLFDRQTGGADVTRTNDGSFWWNVVSGSMTSMAAGDFLSSVPLNNRPADTSETIQLDPSDMATLFQLWGERANLLREESFLGAMGDLLRSRGYADTEICDVFARHTAGSCPTYASLPLSSFERDRLRDLFDATETPALPPSDMDRDGVPDTVDNCPAEPNAAQRDANQNGFGNACDPDVDGDGRVTTDDLDRVVAALDSHAGEADFDFAADFDGNGRVDDADLSRFHLLLYAAYAGEAPPTIVELAPFDPAMEVLWLESFGSSSSAGGWSTTRHPRMVADVDGDGIDDVVGFATAGVYVALSDGEGLLDPSFWSSDFGRSNGWQVGTHPRFLRDVNGDGRADVVGFSNGGVEVALSTGDGFTATERWHTGFARDAGGWSSDRHPRFVEDVNGDGLADVVGIGSSRVYVSLSNGAHFRPVEVWSYDFHYNDGWRTDAHPRELVDVNGDGLLDLVGFSNYGPEVALNDGGRFVPQARTLANFGWQNGSWDPARHLRFLRDVNGDGFLDIVGFGDRAIWVSLGDGVGFAPQAAWLVDFTAEQGYGMGSHPRFVEDVDGDGLDDIVAIHDATVWVARSNGQGFDPPQQVGAGFGLAQLWSPTEAPRLLGDIDGDALPELVGFGSQGVSVGELTLESVVVPEPAFGAGLAVGLAALTGVARRSRQRVIRA